MASDILELFSIIVPSNLQRRDMPLSFFLRSCTLHFGEVGGLKDLQLELDQQRKEISISFTLCTHIHVHIHRAITLVI